MDRVTPARERGQRDRPTPTGGNAKARDTVWLLGFFGGNIRVSSASLYREGQDCLAAGTLD
jgi:hypothetical protein